ncbi:hypothetical protein WA026_003717 [Henosepilachna vigintioctopunctata]|uniref:Uncharacterized protein n=1 Tax=Henosepilachna vigintioctopunctata TaxID=420089 RepID=A0AAW1UE23_9CUCU
MERIESLSDSTLCLQDLVTGVTTSSASDLHHSGIHHLHDSVSSAVSVNSTLSGIMSGGSSVLGHHLESSHHHGVVPHTPSLHSHEPLEKLKRGEQFSIYRERFSNLRQNLILNAREKSNKLESNKQNNKQVRNHPGL